MDIKELIFIKRRLLERELVKNCWNIKNSETEVRGILWAKEGSRGLLAVLFVGVCEV